MKKILLLMAISLGLFISCNSNKTKTTEIVTEEVLTEEVVETIVEEVDSVKVESNDTVSQTIIEDVEE